jgi:ketosteroid isomerase-like protein
MAQNEDLVRRGYEAFGAGDMETLNSLMADDVVHTIPGNNRFTGEHKGRDELMTLYSELFRVSGGTYRADLVSIEERGDNQVVAVHHGTAERDGRKLDTNETLTFTIEGSKITRIESSFSPADEAVEDAFWGTTG